MIKALKDSIKAKMFKEYENEVRDALRTSYNTGYDDALQDVLEGLDRLEDYLTNNSEGYNDPNQVVNLMRDKVMLARED